MVPPQIEMGILKGIELSIGQQIEITSVCTFCFVFFVSSMAVGGEISINVN